jgi:hypothetical protein
MVFFGLINYENYLLETIIKSKYAKNVLLIMYLYLVSAIIKFHIALLLCFYFEIRISTSIWTFYRIITLCNLISPILINILLSFLSNTIYGYVSTHKKYFEDHIDLIIRNYSKQNLILWKRKIMLCICIYIIFSTVVITIDNYLIFVSTLQTAISFIICDFLENPENLRQYKKLNIFIDNINQLIFPRVYHKNNTIIDDYMSPMPKSMIINVQNNNNIIEPLSLNDDINDENKINDENLTNKINDDINDYSLTNNIINDENLKNEEILILTNDKINKDNKLLFESPIFNVIKKKLSIDDINIIEEKPKTPPSIKSNKTFIYTINQ